jgi:hypothetical protein
MGKWFEPFRDTRRRAEGSLRFLAFATTNVRTRGADVRPAVAAGTQQAVRAQNVPSTIPRTAKLLTFGTDISRQGRAQPAAFQDLRACCWLSSVTNDQALFRLHDCPGRASMHAKDFRLCIQRSVAVRDQRLRNILKPVVPSPRNSLPKTPLS